MIEEQEIKTGVKQYPAKPKRAVNEISAKEFQARQPKAKKLRASSKPSKVLDQLEGDITRAIRSSLNAARVRHWKQWQGPLSEAGIPDIIGLKKVRVDDLVAQGVEFVGIFVAIEVKTRTGVVSPDQTKWINRFKTEGGIAFVARSVDEAIDGLGIRDRFLF